MHQSLPHVYGVSRPLLFPLVVSANNLLNYLSTRVPYPVQHEIVIVWLLSKGQSAKNHFSALDVGFGYGLSRGLCFLCFKI